MFFSRSAIFNASVNTGRLLASVIIAFLVGCGGGGSSSSQSQAASTLSSIINISSASSSLVVSRSSSFSSSSLSVNVAITGVVTYDFVPHTLDGLNYAATTARPGRGLLVELLDENNQALASTLTDGEGKYSASVVRDKLIKVRVKAQLLRNQSPGWNFKVTDNTNNNSLYSMSGSLVAATEATSMRNLHASSGWTGTSYSNSRVAAPFAILDSIYIGVERIQAANNLAEFPALELRWSTKNKAAEGDPELGEIGTSYYNGDAIYILGDENNDTDEYDRHVILHEWGHYIESSFSRSDSTGGDHSHEDKLDMRIAMSEGFANAFSAMMLDDPGYRDSSGIAQSDGFFNDVSNKNNSVRGWYSEASVQSVIYNFYVNNNGKTGREFADIFQVITNNSYVESDAFISMYVFADQLRNNMPGQAVQFNSLLNEQSIAVADEYGAGESNSGGYVGSLPVYKNLVAGSPSINTCSTNRFGSYNKLATAQFFTITITTPGVYQVYAEEAGDDSGGSDPDLYLFRRGNLIDLAESSTTDQESFFRFLVEGIYVLELVDARVMDVDETADVTACFNVHLQMLN